MPANVVVLVHVAGHHQQSRVPHVPIRGKQAHAEAEPLMSGVASKSVLGALGKLWISARYIVPWGAKTIRGMSPRVPGPLGKRYVTTRRILPSGRRRRSS